MKKIAISCTLIGLIAFAVACSPKKASTGSAGPMLTKAVASTQYSSTQLEEGRALFTTKCGTCHKLREPILFTDTRWEGILNKMIPKSKATPEEAKLIRAYVVANSKS